MSVFLPGVGGTLKATNQPGALLELAYMLSLAELLSVEASPVGLTRQHLTLTMSLDTGTVDIAASMPFTAVGQTDGSIQVLAIDYLGSPYSAFHGGGGTLNATHLMAAFVEMAQTLAAAEQRQPVEDRPNNIQVSADFEAEALNISANLPFMATALLDGSVLVTAIDYLPTPPPPPPPSAAGIAYVASQSNAYGNQFGTYANLTDGDGTTGTITYAAGGWIQATFPEVVSVSAVQVGGGNVRNVDAVAGYANGSQLQHSVDNAAWATVLTISGVTDSGMDQFKTFVLTTPITARYWRLNRIGADTGTSEFKFT